MKCPLDFWLWQQSMNCQFGQKWAKLHHGRMWNIITSSSASQHLVNRGRDTTEVIIGKSDNRDLFVFNYVNYVGIGEYPWVIRTNPSSRYSRY